MSFGLWRIENTFVLSLELRVMTLEAANQPDDAEQTRGQSKSSQYGGSAE